MFNILCHSIVQGFQCQITALQEEMEDKDQEMNKLRQELKDKEVENRIAGKKGDQLVRINWLVPFVSFYFSVSCLFVLFHIERRSSQL